VQAQSFLTTAIAEATRAQDYETLARALLFDIFLNTLPDQMKWDQALRSLDKMELLIDTKGLEDIFITCLFLRAYIATQRKSFEQASTYLWRAYEMAQNHGHHLLIPNLLLQMGQIYRELGQNNQAQIFFDLSLRGVDSVRHPRQFRRITQVVNPLAVRSNLQHDFVIHEASGVIQEKQRGYIDFKNQHVLLDMALLFLKSQGQRFTKESLTESVWKQAYNPSQHDNLIYVSIKRLRALIEPDPENPRYILRDRRGYYFSSNCSISFELPQETRP
jgi:DNA-binding winged helix-turn-helix (wHTH) protein